MKVLLKQVCGSCGSEDVLCDAYASWDFQKQEWVLSNTFDKGAFCNKCDGECRIEDQEIPVDETNIISIDADSFAACPTCNVRLDADIDPETNDNRVVDTDEDGPINLGTCMEHGAFLFQITS